MTEINLEQFRWTYNQHSDDYSNAKLDLVADGRVFHLSVFEPEEGGTAVEFTHDVDEYPHSIEKRDVTEEELKDAAVWVVHQMDSVLPKSEDVSVH